MATKHPRFKRTNIEKFSRLVDTWRKPRGIDSKQARKKKAFGAVPTIGYAGPKATRHLHPCGLKEKLIANVAELEKLDAKKECARIRRTVGTKKRAAISARAAQLKIKVLNA